MRYWLAAVAAAALCACESRLPAPPRPENVAELANGTVLEDLAAVPLATEALAGEEILRQRIATEMTRARLTYLVQCALLPDQSVTLELDGEQVELSGILGLAPGWAEGPCDEACQEWVSACLLARSNAYGVAARIYLVAGGHPDITPASPPEDVPVLEGAFYGNLFVDPPRTYACRGRGRDPLYDAVRVCTHPGSPCRIQAVGPCLDEDDAIPHACEQLDEHGNFRRCHNRLRLDGGQFPEGSQAYDRVVTTYLPATAFAGDGGTKECREGSAPGEFPVRTPRAGPGSIGDSCGTDDDCNREDLLCLLSAAGQCTRGCVKTGDPTQDEEQCEQPGATCQDDGFCRLQCTATIAGGDGCGPGTVCTAYHLTSGVRDPTVCHSFCSSDADCHGSTCDRRTGRCGVEIPEGPGRARDGTPCTEQDECLGHCQTITPGRALCASLLDRSRGTSCPDPDIEPYFASSGEDDLGICVFKRCSDPGDCAPPLVCGPRGCTYP